jgi:HD-GYP domain-containing protein (c-di-GMP phosphodiesterase class II)
MHTESLAIHKGGTNGDPIEFYPIALYGDDGKPNEHMVAAWAALSGETVNIPDAYASKQFDFSGTRSFDSKTGYRSSSFLTIPMTNHENEIIGVLQLINALDPETGEVRAFTELDQHIVESLASQAAVSITNRSLIEAQKELFDAMIKLIASAIDEKSPYTGGHCRRVPMLTNMIAAATCQVNKGPLKDFNMSEDEKYALDVAGWLHDCGKITTPEYVVDKSTKLETIFDRINLIDTRIEMLKRDLKNKVLRKKLQQNGIDTDVDSNEDLSREIEQLDSDREFIRKCNIGGESMSDEDIQHIYEIAERKWIGPDGQEQNMLSDNEVNNLIIGRGTLTMHEREIINNHISMTIIMLESLTYPKHLLAVPEYAGGHHEKMDGTGYPKRLTREQMSVPARMMGIADIFEALTAGDRPYKKGMKLSQALTILGRMKLENHIDPDLFDVFMDQKIYQEYADEYLPPEQIDEIDPTTIPGYQPLE